MIEDLAAARLQMALSLGWHIIIASFGVGMPAVTVIGLPFAMEGIAFFIEAIFLGIYLYAWIFWDLVSGGTRCGAARRELIERSIGPVWEANHVWLILVVTLFWTAFPPAFASFASTLYIPLTAAALGIIGRGAAFAFRKASDTLAERRIYGARFAASSVITPFFLGTVVGGIASRRVPSGVAAGDIWTTVEAAAGEPGGPDRRARSERRRPADPVAALALRHLPAHARRVRAAEGRSGPGPTARGEAAGATVRTTTDVAVAQVF